jgi:hypothetical protein
MRRSNLEETCQVHLIGTALQHGSASLTTLPPVLYWWQSKQKPRNSPSEQSRKSVPGPSHWNGPASLTMLPPVLYWVVVQAKTKKQCIGTISVKRVRSVSLERPCNTALPA